MELAEISPFLLVLSDRNYKGTYTEVSLDDFEEAFAVIPESPRLKKTIFAILEEFPHKSYVPVQYLLKHPLLKNDDPTEIIRILIDCPKLTPVYNRAGLCFSFQNKQKVAKLADIIEENPYNIFGEVIKVVFDSKKGKLGEDLIVSLTNGIEKMYKNTSENYLKSFQEKPKDIRKTKKKSECVINRQPTQVKVLRDISNN
ncbi:hypothetical protein SteCoe_4673 [Stentor coeruleus]|uniref:Uncharacterized protein n=1 Tax=Stentor coeruleus TaxID=5963 RepID=A0A1R2CU82_9CILI|nr:hypothetical protein SteCoe_4673 [Stentor coeruleus]